MTSIYPSVKIKFFLPDFEAKLRANKLLLFLKTGVSEVLIYLGVSPVKVLAPKAITLPLTSIIGNISLPQNLSISFPFRDLNAKFDIIISSLLNPIFLR